MKPAKNIVPFDLIISQQDRPVMNAHKSGLLWFSGLSGSGCLKKDAGSA
jgi:adenylylsulfate kinase-like enzyme